MKLKKKYKIKMIKKFGVNHPLQNNQIQYKIKNTCLLRYGVKNPFQNKEIKEKIKNTCLEKYGVEHFTQNKEIKEKIKNTCLQRYGVQHPMQNPDILDKMIKNSYYNKDYILPSGKIIKIQGYENFALDELLKNDISEEEIVTGTKNVPLICYQDKNNKNRKHYVDIFIPNQNKCIEIKSTWTFETQKDVIFLKQTAGKELGYQYEIWVYDAKGNKINTIS